MQAAPSVKLKLPKKPYPALQRLMASDERSVLVESAPMTGVVDTLLTWLMSRAWETGAAASTSGLGFKGHFAWVSPEPEKAFHTMHNWLARAGLFDGPWRDAKLIKVSGTSIHLPAGAVHFLAERHLNKVHCKPLLDAVIHNAHDLSMSVREWIAQEALGKVRWIGRRENWYAEMLDAADSDVHRISLTDAVLGGWVTEVRAQAIKDSTPLDDFQWRYLLQKPKDEVESEPFLAFARKRLRVKTDKPLGVLSPEQRLEAEHQEGTPIVPFITTALQRKYLAHKRVAIKKAKVAGRGARILLLKYRRGGFTTLEQGLSYQMCVQRRRSEVATIAHTKASTQRIFGIAKLFADQDPRRPRLEGDSKSALEFFHTHSKFFIGTAGSHAFARGDTLQRVHCSEVAFWCRGPNNQTDVETLMAAITGAASFGEVVCETTPNGSEWFKNAYEEGKKGLNNWYPIFLPWYVDPMNVATATSYDPDEIEGTLTEEENDLMIQASREYGVILTWAHIAWRRATKKDYKRLFPQEFPENDVDCFLTSGSSFFDIDVLAHLVKVKSKRRVGVRSSIKGGGYKHVWEKPKAGIRYVAGTDTSEGTRSGDLNGTAIMRKDNGAQVAVIHGRWRPDELATLSLDLVKEYNDALWGIERNNHGHSVIQKVREIAPARYKRPPWHEGRFYFHLPMDRYKSFDARKAAKPGWLTDGISRPLLLDDLYEWFEGEDVHKRCRHEEFISECLDFVKQDNGKYEGNGHDDTVFMWGIANQMRKIPMLKAQIVA